MWALIEKEEGVCSEVLGLFTAPDVSEEELTKYYGVYYEESHLQVDDSGVVWEKVVRCGGERYVLTLIYFEDDTL